MPNIHFLNYVNAFLFRHLNVNQLVMMKNVGKVAFVDIALNIEKITLTWTDNDLKNVRLS